LVKINRSKNLTLNPI